MILEAKARVPLSAVRPVRRERLFAVLDEKKPVTVVSGPAGAGKTTLLAEWARELKGHAAWATLDARDDDPSRLWTTLARALEFAGIPGITAELTSLANAVAAMGAPVYLILDEVDNVRDTQALHGVETLIRQPPENLRIVLAARVPPRLHLSRLRLEGKLLEIGMPELAFTPAEAAAVLAGHQVRVPDRDLAALMRRTEGWPAAVRLAAMSLGGDSPDPPAEDPAVVDYLNEEVLGPHPERTKRFLRATSICATVSGDLATTLSGCPDAGALLETLVRTNTLVERVDRSAYRYHPILRDVLLAELDREPDSVRRGLRQVAAEWFRAAGHPMTALEHAVSAGHHRLTHELVEAYGLQELLNGHAESLHQLLNGLRANPVTSLVAASAAISVRARSAADEHLAAVGPPPTAHVRALHATVRLQRAQLDGDTTESPDTLTATATHRSGDPDLDTLSMITRGTALSHLGELAGAERVLRQALSLAADARHEYAVFQCVIALAAIAGARGDLARMDAEAAKAVAHAQDWDCSRAYALRGAYSYLCVDTVRLREFADKAPELSILLSPSAERVRAWWCEARTTPQLTAYVAPALLRIALRADHQDWVTEVTAHVARTLPRTAELALVEAMVAAHRGKQGQARQILAPILTNDVEPVAVTTRIHAWLLDSAVLAETGDWHRAHGSLAKALALAEPLAVLRPFADGGPVIRELLVRGAGRFGKLDHFASAALRTLPVSSAPLLDRLTSREQDLLVELPSMRTTEEIAGSLFVSVNTVKTHLRGIYRKLGVNHRRDAVAVARQRGLL